MDGIADGGCIARQAICEDGMLIDAFRQPSGGKVIHVSSDLIR
ncbi:hypothetical protein [Streptomyces aquilus]|nr:hypothetical protein [Streptomyces aquilus]